MIKSTTLFTSFTLLLFSNINKAQVYVDDGAAGSNNGTSWADAYSDLSDALNNATVGDTIWVAGGTYVPGANVTDVFTVSSGVSIFGGFDGTETLINQRDISSNQTIISGDIGVAGDQTDNCNNLIDASNLTTASLIDGFILEQTNGGSAMTLDNAQIILRNTTIRDCRSPIGAAIATTSSELTMINCVINNNINTSGGGTVYTTSGTTRLYNTALYRNSGTGGAACFVFSGGEQTLVNCTVVGNTATLYPNGGAVSTSNNGFSYVSNSILWGNHYQNDSNEVSQISNYTATGTTVITHSIVQHYTDTADITGISISASDPMFEDINDVNMLQVMSGSPAIDSGRNDSIPYDITDHDLDGDFGEQLPLGLGGNTRIISTLVDLGAYEYQPTFQTVDEYDQNLQAKLYPSLSSQPVNLEITIDKPEEVVITMIDMSGKQVRRPINQPLLAGKNTLVIPQAGLKGRFLVVITSNKERKSLPVFFY